MIKGIKIIIFFTVLLSHISNLNAEITNKIIISVGKKIITKFDISKEEKHLNFLSLGQFSKLDEKERIEIAKTNLIRDRIKENELNSYTKITISDDKLNYYIKQSMDSMGFVSKEQFIKKLSEYDLTYEDYISKLNLEIKWNELVSNLYIRLVSVDPKKIEKKIESMKQNNFIDEYLISEIFLTAESISLLKEKINIVNKSIAEIGFHNSAIKFSSSDTSNNYGKLGWLQENQLSNEILSSIKDLKNSKVTNPISINSGALILFIEDKRKTEIPINLKETFEKLVLIEKNRQIERFSLNHFNKIKNNTSINEF